MLSSLYRMAARILSREGTTATLTQQATEGTYNPATGIFSPSTAVTTTVKVVLLDYTISSSGITTKSGTIIEAGDKQCYCDAKVNGVDLATKISPAGDTITVGGGVWRVMNVKEYNPSNTYTILYELQLRK